MKKSMKKDGFNRRDFLKRGSATTLLAMAGGMPLSGAAAPVPPSDSAAGAAQGPDPGSNPATAFPRVWMSTEAGATAEHFADLAAHGVELIETRDFKNARRHGLKTMFMGGQIRPQDVTRMGLTPEYAVAIGGTYRDLSIDSHTFAFSKGPQTVVIGLPIFFAPYDWKTGKYFTEDQTFGQYFDSSYFSTDRAFKAEAVVRQRDYDGKQHLAIVPAEISGRSRTGLRLRFDLSKVEGDLDHVMLAVYWRTRQLSPAAASTRQATARLVRESLEQFAKENGGAFPGDVVHAMRFADECFLMTSFAHSPKCSLPLYDYSESGIAAYLKLNGTDDYPRAWGFPEAFGVNAYRDWLYAFHTCTAALVKAVVEAAHKVAPEIIIFRNPTRFNPTPFATLPNDHDGCSTQLLAQQFDMINADPYPVARNGDSQHRNSDRDPRPGYIESIIPLESAYWSGLVRRFNKKLVTWLQAHTFAHDLQHISPSDAHHIYSQAVRYNPDGLMWLGYQPGDTAESPFLGMTLPDARPETWKALRTINDRTRRDLGKPKKTPDIAVLRFYGERSLVDLERRNLHDRFLTEQILTGLTMDLDIPYDVFEYYRREDVDWRELRSYRRVILCVLDLKGLPLHQWYRQNTAVSVVCWDPTSLAANPSFTGITRLQPIAGQSISVTGPTGVALPSNLAFAATLRFPAVCLARAGDACCAWRNGNVLFATFLPSDPFDDGEYVKWLLNGDIAV
jgi:hypothetical protein